MRTMMQKQGNISSSAVVEKSWLARKLAIGLCILLSFQAIVVESQEPAAQQVSNPQSPASTPPALPGEDPIPSAPTPQITMLAQQSQPAQQPASPQEPVGTAAAPYEKPTGVPGSRPAGAAIAPAKQRRVRAIVIRVGLILAGAGAVGAVVGLSKASHSQP